MKRSIPSGTPRRRPAQARSAATVDAILTGAARVLAERGLDGANTNRIAEAAGVAIGTLYQYFPNKEAVLRSLLGRERARAQAAVKRALREHANSPLEVTTRAVLSAAVAAALVTADIHELLHHEIASTLGDSRGGAEGRSVIERDLVAFLESRRAELHFSSAAAAAFTIVQSIHSLLHEVLAAPRSELIPALVDEGTRLVLGYLRGAAADRQAAQGEPSASIARTTSPTK